MDFLEVAKAIGELGILIVIAGAVIFLLVWFFKAVFEGKFEIRRREEKTIHAINGIEYDSVIALQKIHPYFNKIDNIINIKLPITRIGGPVRTEIFRDVLKIFYKTQKQIVIELLGKDITKDNFYVENMKAVHNMSVLADEAMKAEGIPEVVRTKFWEWSYKRHQYILSTLSDIDSCVVFNTIVEKQYATLDLYQNYSYFILMDAENTLINLNGDLTGTIYKGKTIESLH